MASPAQAQEVHAFIRKWLAENVSPDVASATRILYGARISEQSRLQRVAWRFLWAAAHLQRPAGACLTCRPCPSKDRMMQSICRRAQHAIASVPLASQVLLMRAGTHASRAREEPGAPTRCAGGSVNDKNSSDLAGMEDIDGFLVGGASLKGASFATICNAKAQVPA